MWKKVGVLLPAMLAVVCTAQAGVLEVHPSLAVSEEYTDNVFETRSDRVSDYITRLMPGFSLTYKAPVFEGDLSYLFDYRYYAKNSRSDDIAHTLIANGHLTAIENLLFLDIGDSYERVSQDVTRDVTRESLFVNQTDRNIATASPYLLLRPTSQTEAKIGYLFMDTRYTSGTLGVDKVDHMGFLRGSYEFTPRWFTTFDYDFVRQESKLDDFNQHQASGGVRYEYADKSFFFAKAGNTWINYDSGNRLNNLFWHAGLTHTFPTMVTTLATGVKYDEDPLSTIVRETYVKGTVEKELRGGTVGGALYYSEFSAANTDTLETRKYGGEIHVGRELTARLSGRVSFLAEKYEQPLIPGITRRLLAEAGLSYLLAEKLSLSLSYIYVDYYSKEIFEDNRHINRGIIEIKKVF